MHDGKSPRGRGPTASTSLGGEPNPWPGDDALGGGEAVADAVDVGDGAGDRVALAVDELLVLGLAERGGLAVALAVEVVLLEMPLQDAD